MVVTYTVKNSVTLKNVIFLICLLPHGSLPIRKKKFFLSLKIHKCTKNDTAKEKGFVLLYKQITIVLWVYS